VIVKKSPAELDAMAAAGEIHTRLMDLLARKIRPGVTTGELDQAAERFIRSQGATPAFKGYHGFPGSICASPNHMVVHGIPGGYALQRGDVLSVDIGVIHDGWVADAACTFAVGEITPVAAKLLDVTLESLHLATAQARPGTGSATCRTRSRSTWRPTASPSSARSSATGSAARCTRSRRSPTTARPARASCSRRGWCSRSSR
jgi:methionine aminopeptidase type I